MDFIFKSGFPADKKSSPIERSFKHKIKRVNHSSNECGLSSNLIASDNNGHTRCKLYIEMVETQEIVYREFLIQHKISCFWSTIANIEIKN